MRLLQPTQVSSIHSCVFNDDFSEKLAPFSHPAQKDVMGPPASTAEQLQKLGLAPHIHPHRFWRIATGVSKTSGHHGVLTPSLTLPSAAALRWPLLHSRAHSRAAPPTAAAASQQQGQRALHTLYRQWERSSFPNPSPQLAPDPGSSHPSSAPAPLPQPRQTGMRALSRLSNSRHGEKAGSRAGRTKGRGACAVTHPTHAHTPHMPTPQLRPPRRTYGRGSALCRFSIKLF